MDIVDIRPAIDQGDMNFIRGAFRAFVDPGETTIRSIDNALLGPAFDLVLEAIEDDCSIMPRTTCETLNFQPGATYGQGVAAARSLGFREALEHLFGRDEGAL